MSTPPADLRKWVRQRRLAEARGKYELRDNAPDPAQALARGLGRAEFAAAVTPATPAGRLTPDDLLAYRRLGSGPQFVFPPADMVFEFPERSPFARS
jgi:hypothetical protein